jgi:hypothetical protein
MQAAASFPSMTAKVGLITKLFFEGSSVVSVCIVVLFMCRIQVSYLLQPVKTMT